MYPSLPSIALTTQESASLQFDKSLADIMVKQVKTKTNLKVRRQLDPPVVGLCIPSP